MIETIAGIFCAIVLLWITGTFWDFVLNHGKSPELRKAQDEAHKKMRALDENLVDVLGPPGV